MKCKGKIVVHASAVITILIVTMAHAQAAVVNVPALKDAMIFGTSAGNDTGNASGNGAGMFAGADGSSNRKRSLIQFDVAANVPAWAQITSVTLNLVLGQVAGSGTGGAGGNVPTRTINLFDVLQDWTEGNSGSATPPGIGGQGQGYARRLGDVTWDYASVDPGNLTTGKWNNGVDLHGGNFSSTASASSTFGLPYNTGTTYQWSSAGMIADVLAWRDTPSSNHGWLIKAMSGIDSGGNTVSIEDTPTSFLGFWTKDGAAANSNSALAPVLSITYIPEPACVALLLVAIPLFAGRRRSEIE